MVDQPKIFGIGLNKTGTSTLGLCGEILKYRCVGCDRSLLQDVVLKGDLSGVKQTVSDFDLFEDWPWPLIYKELDRLFPHSKFILTVRKSEDAWFESLKNHSLTSRPFRNCRKLAYGFHYPHKRRKEHIEFYRSHNQEVRRYFEERPDDFIEICWETGDDFEKLCNFLNRDVPPVLLPHANKGVNRRVSRRRHLINRLLSNPLF